MGDKKLADELFALFDKDGNGYLTEEELRKGLSGAGFNPTKDDIDSILADMHITGKGKDNHTKITKDQFTETIIKYSAKHKLKSKEEMEKEFMEAFGVFDRNKDGRVDVKELGAALKSLGEKMTDKQLKEMIKIADVDGDGKLCQKEFVKLLLEDIPK